MHAAERSPWSRDRVGLPLTPLPPPLPSTLSSRLQEHPSHVNACPQLPVLQAAHASSPSEDAPANGSTGPDGGEQQAPWLLCAQRNEVDLWQLPESAGTAQLGPPAEGVLLSPSAAPEHLLRLVVQSGRHVAAAAISPCGRWLAYSDSQRVSCFALEQRPADALVPDEHVMPAPLALPADLPPACHLAFRPGTAELVACSSDGTLRLVDLSACGTQQLGASGGEAVQAVRAVHDLQYKSSLRRDRQRNAARRLMPAVELMAVSPDGRCVFPWLGRQRCWKGWPMGFHGQLAAAAAFMVLRCTSSHSLLPSLPLWQLAGSGGASTGAPAQPGHPQAGALAAATGGAAAAHHGTGLHRRQHSTRDGRRHAPGGSLWGGQRAAY